MVRTAAPLRLRVLQHPSRGGGPPDGIGPAHTVRPDVQAMADPGNRYLQLPRAVARQLLQCKTGGPDSDPPHRAQSRPYIASGADRRRAGDIVGPVDAFACDNPAGHGAAADGAVDRVGS